MNTDLENPLAQIELIDVEIPLVHPFRTSFGEEKHKQAILVKITDTKGNVGWGETCVSTNPGYCYETIKTAWHIQNDFLIPILKKFNQNPSELTITDLLDKFEPVRGHEFAKAGIEAALWTLKSVQEGKSLGELYGASKSKIPTGVSIGIQNNLDYLLSRISSFLDLGYHRIKIKIEPGWDIDVIKRLRKEFGDIQLMVDANSAFRLSEKHIALFQDMDQFGLTMIEQPLPHNDMLLHKKLQAEITTPVCLDESIHDLNGAEMAMEFECCKIINIKPARVGGFYNAMKIAEFGGPGVVWCGGMLETGIGRIHNLFLQANSNFTIPGDTSGSQRYFHQDIIEPAVTVCDDGYVEIPTGIGLGYTVREDMISKYSVKKHKATLDS